MTKVIGTIYYRYKDQELTQEKFMELVETNDYYLLKTIKLYQENHIEEVTVDEKLLESVIIREDYHILDRILKYIGYEGFCTVLYLLGKYCKKNKHKEFFYNYDGFYDECGIPMKFLKYDTVITDYINTHSN